MIKEIRVKPLEADNKEGKIMAYIFFFQPILCVIVASFIIYMNKELFRLDLVAQIAIGVFILLAISAFFTNYYLYNFHFLEVFHSHNITYILHLKFQLYNYKLLEVFHLHNT